MLHADARRAARRVGGAYVPLEEQDLSLRDEGKIDRADALLRAAGEAGRFGRFQCEAAIQSVHAERRATGRVNSATLVTLYGALARFRPTPGALTARAATYQPFHATRAAALAAAGHVAEARAAYDRAAGLAEDPAVRDSLADRRDQLSQRS
jgi:RNA polymerase sigma-70 factor (ECF subfamily)